MISEEVTLKTLRLFPKKCNKGNGFGVFDFKRKLTYLLQAIFFLSGC